MIGILGDEVTRSEGAALSSLGCLSAEGKGYLIYSRPLNRPGVEALCDVIDGIGMKKDISLVLEVFEAEEAARFFSATFIGLLMCVKQGLMSVVEAEKLLFSPRIAQVLKRKGVSSQVCDVIMECCELGDVLDLIPHHFESSIDSLTDRFSDFLRTSKICERSQHFTELR